MKICILSDYTGFLDEGMRNIAYHIDTHMSTRHQVKHVCLKPLSNLLRSSYWSNIGSFDPDIIHFVPGSTLKTFLFVKALKMRFPRAKVVMSALHPVLSAVSQRLVPFLRPDLILTQSFEAEQMLGKLGCNTRFLLNGVDTKKFAPVSNEVKKGLRRRYNLDESRFIVLHVGHLQRGRNLKALTELQRMANVQVLVVVSTSVGGEERNISRELIDEGCLVWSRYFENIEDVYSLSDCYIFPTFNRRNSVDFPLSIMEAMACNLPVITTSFGAVPRIFKAGQGLFFAADEDQIPVFLSQVMMNKEDIRTREKVLDYSWKKITDDLERIYYGVIEGESR